VRFVSTQIDGYSYGSSNLATASVAMEELEALKISAGLTEEDEEYLRLAGLVLGDQTRQVVEHWRSGIIASIPNLARHSRSIDGGALPEYLAKSNLRFEQWILDTCLRPYDQTWLNYQIEIARRHMSPKKNETDGVQSTPYVPFRDIIGFIAVMNETIKPYLADKGNTPEEVERMHSAWCKSIQLQLALWAKVYMSTNREQTEW
jgi:Protoglobin